MNSTALLYPLLTYDVFVSRSLRMLDLDAASSACYQLPPNLLIPGQCVSVVIATALRGMKIVMISGERNVGNVQ